MQSHFLWAGSDSTKLPHGFVDLKDMIPSIVTDIRYFTSYNFVGKRINGYKASKCILTREAVTALSQVQKELNKFSLSLKVFDCYRPQRAVNHFVEWAKDIRDKKYKKVFYPTVLKEDLFKQGYLARKSGHSRGSTVDITIIPLDRIDQNVSADNDDFCECCSIIERRRNSHGLDMGSGFDCFHEKSQTTSGNIDPQHLANRILLKTIMERYGFINYSKEWWHFTLKNEPYPHTYFNFVIN